MSEYIVVGAGIVGASTAYHLAKAGCSVTILDKEVAGQATKAAAGIICPWLSKRRNKVWYELAKVSAAYYPILTDELEQLTHLESSYRQVGALLLRDSEEKLIELVKLAKERRKEAPEIGEIDIWHKDKLHSHYPFLSEKFGAVFISGAGRVKGGAYTDALLRAAIMHGAVYRKAEARLNQDLQVTVSGETFYADQVFLTTGAWLPELFAQADYHIDIAPQKGQLLRLQFPNKDTAAWPVILPPSSKSIVPFGEGEVLAGATHEKMQGFDLAPTKAAVEEIIRDLSPFIPKLGKMDCQEITVGTRPYTKDFTPFIGFFPGNRQLLLANGLGASGLTTGPYVGKVLADIALGKNVPISLSKFDPANYIKVF